MWEEYQAASSWPGPMYALETGVFSIKVDDEQAGVDDDH